MMISVLLFAINCGLTKVDRNIGRYYYLSL
jgi:hypothetical protein